MNPDIWTVSKVGRKVSLHCPVPRTAHYSLRALCALALSALLLSLMLAAPRARAQDAIFTQQVEARVLALVNDLRTEHGLPALQRESTLDQTADYFAGYMARTERLDHRADGATPAGRVKQRGYVYCNLSENIAMEYSSRGFAAETLARDLVEGWRDSPTHRANILDRVATQTGVGISRNGKGEYYAAQLFGRPPVPGAKKGQACPR